jgi:hypothetical protein
MQSDGLKLSWNPSGMYNLLVHTSIIFPSSTVSHSGTPESRPRSGIGMSHANVDRIVLEPQPSRRTSATPPLLLHNRVQN